MSISTFSKATFNAEALAVQSLLSNFNSPWKMQLYFLQKLPSLYFWGVRIKECTPEKASVTIPFSWRSQNPFRSTYFAALSGAAELSTGALAMVGVAGRGKVSMLVIKVKSQYFKKADAAVTFTCEQGGAIIDTINRAIETGEGQQFEATSTGRLPTGEVACEMKITWSFKSKK